MTASARGAVATSPARFRFLAPTASQTDCAGRAGWLGAVAERAAGGVAALAGFLARLGWGKVPGSPAGLAACLSDWAICPACLAGCLGGTTDKTGTQYGRCLMQSVSNLAATDRMELFFVAGSNISKPFL